MELEIKTDLSVLPDSLSTNLAEVKNWVIAQTEKYDAIVLDESQTAWAKADIAKMRKLAKALDEGRLDVKRQWMRPYSDFEAQCKEIRAILDAKISGLDAQVKAFESAKREAKKAELVAHFAEHVKEAGDYITFSDVFDPKWLNLTCSIEKAKSEIEETISRYREDVHVLEESCGRLSPSGAFALREKYRETKSLPVAIAYLNKMRDAENDARTLQAKDEGNGDEEQDGTVEMVFRVWGTPEQFMRLKSFLLQTGMSYEKA